MILEIGAYNIESALFAQEGRADRIELCDNFSEGGTTPSYGLIEVVRQHIGMDLYVMIRPRGGDFNYSSYEFYAMKRDILQCQKLSVDGIVIGMLNHNGTIDMKRCRELIDKARPLKVTCSRAFDITRDPFEALEDCIDVGFDRIFTAGQQPSAIEGASLIFELIKRAEGRISVMPGKGISSENVTDLIKITNAKEIHFSAKAYRDSNMLHRNKDVSIGVDNQEFRVQTVDANEIKMIRSIIEG